MRRRPFVRIAAIGLAAVLGALSIGIGTPRLALGAQSPAECTLPGTGAVGAIDFGHYQRPLGRVSALMIFVDFPDAPAIGPTSGAQDMLLPDAQGWLATASYGQLQLVVSSVPRWFRMPQPSTAYGWDRGLSFEAHQEYIADAVAAADAEVDFAGYDLYYIVANREAEAIDHSPAFVGGTDSEVEADGAQIGLAVTFGADLWDWGFRLLDHETGHLFGLPDLYVEQQSDADDQFRFIGGWDLMGDIDGKAPDFLGWSKWLLGWLSASQVTCLNTPATTEVVLTPLATPGGRKLIALRTGTHALTAVELRTLQGNDAAGCDEGVLIYRLFNGVASGAGPVRVADADAGEGVPDGCAHELDDAAWTPSDGAYVDATGGLRIEVLSLDDVSARVRVTRTSAWTPPDVRHARRLTLAMSARSATGLITASGRLTVPDGYAACAAARIATLQVRRGTSWATVRTAATTSSGVWSYRWRAPAGTYRLVAPQTIIAGRPRNVCLAVTSTTRAVR